MYQFSQSTTKFPTIRTVWVSILVALVAALVYDLNSEEEAMTPSAIKEWSLDENFLITGGTGSLGYHAVLHLKKANTAYQVIFTARSDEKCQRTIQDIHDDATLDAETEEFHTKLRCIVLDLSSRDSIREAASQLQEEKNLTLILNAHDITSAMRVNHLHNFFFTHLLFDELKRVVVVSSLAAYLPWNVLSPSTTFNETIPAFNQYVFQYSTSKRANLHFANELHRRCRDNRLMVTASHPGVAKKDKLGTMKPQQGSLSHIRAAIDPSLSDGAFVGHRYGLWGNTMVVGTLESSWHHWPLDIEEGKKLWDMSLEELGIDEFGRVNTAAETE